MSTGVGQGEFKRMESRKGGKHGHEREKEAAVETWEGKGEDVGPRGSLRGEKRPNCYNARAFRRWLRVPGGFGGRRAARGILGADEVSRSSV